MASFLKKYYIKAVAREPAPRLQISNTTGQVSCHMIREQPTNLW